MTLSAQKFKMRCAYVLITTLETNVLQKEIFVVSPLGLELYLHALIHFHGMEHTRSDTSGKTQAGLSEFLL